MTKVLHAFAFVVSGAAGLVAIVIDEGAGFSLGVIFTLFCGVWWLSARLQRLQDKIEFVSKIVARLPCQLSKCDQEKEEE